MNLKEIIEQLEKCKFVDPLGHKIENNVAFIELKKRSQYEDEIVGCDAFEQSSDLREKEKCSLCQWSPRDENCMNVQKQFDGVFIRRFEWRGTNDSAN